MTKVLLVEDEESFSDPLSYLLKQEGFEVAVAETGPDALAEFDRSGADIVLLDVMLPGLSGTEVCRAIRSVPTHMGWHMRGGANLLVARGNLLQMGEKLLENVILAGVARDARHHQIDLPGIDRPRNRHDEIRLRRAAAARHLALGVADLRGAPDGRQNGRVGGDEARRGGRGVAAAGDLHGLVQGLRIGRRVVGSATWRRLCHRLRCCSLTTGAGGPASRYHPLPPCLISYITASARAISSSRVSADPGSRTAMPIDSPIGCSGLPE